MAIGVGSPTQNPRSATSPYMASLRAIHTTPAALTIVLTSFAATMASYYKLGAGGGCVDARIHITCNR